MKRKKYIDSKKHTPAGSFAAWILKEDLLVIFKLGLRGRKNSWFWEWVAGIAVERKEDESAGEVVAAIVAANVRTACPLCSCFSVTLSTILWSPNSDKWSYPLGPNPHVGVSLGTSYSFLKHYSLPSFCFRNTITTWKIKEKGPIICDFSKCISFEWENITL